jgi:hypothetical protein
MPPGDERSRENSSFMARRIETTATVGPDGALTLDHRLELPPGRHHVVLLFDEAPPEQEPLDWPEFVKATYGSLADIPITREPEGEFEQWDEVAAEPLFTRLMR